MGRVSQHQHRERMEQEVREGSLLTVVPALCCHDEAEEEANGAEGEDHQRHSLAAPLIVVYEGLANRFHQTHRRIDAEQEQGEEEENGEGLGGALALEGAKSGGKGLEAEREGGR